MTAADYANILELAMAEKLPEQGGEHQANK
jgi:hypothetical protein